MECGATMDHGCRFVRRGTKPPPLYTLLGSYTIRDLKGEGATRTTCTLCSHPSGTLHYALRLADPFVSMIKDLFRPVRSPSYPQNQVPAPPLAAPQASLLKTPT